MRDFARQAERIAGDTVQREAPSPPPRSKPTSPSWTPAPSLTSPTMATERTAGRVKGVDAIAEAVEAARAAGVAIATVATTRTPSARGDAAVDSSEAVSSDEPHDDLALSHAQAPAPLEPAGDDGATGAFADLPASLEVEEPSSLPAEEPPTAVPHSEAPTSPRPEPVTPVAVAPPPTPPPPAEPDPNEISGAPAAPRRGWWRRSG